MKTIVVAVVLLAALVAAIVYAVDVWLSLGDVEMGFHGKLAIVLCVVAVTGLGVGLMRLTYYSHQHGYDDRAAGAEAEESEKTEDV